MEVIEGGQDIIKPGTNVLVKKDCHDVPIGLDWRTFHNVGAQADVEENGRVVLVSSAAIAAGMIVTGTTVRPENTDMPELQRLFSTGWHHLLQAWGTVVPNRHVGGVLLTRPELNPHDTAHKQERNEALRTMHALLKHGDQPIVNEDDVVSHDEITFGDNDILAALLAVNIARSSLFSGEVRLFLLSNTNGVYENKDDPRTRIPIITDTDEYRHLALSSDSEYGSGGMESKFHAADIVHAVGIDMWIYDPRNGDHRKLAVNGKIGTYFPANVGALATGSQITERVVQ